jgi:small GTP-binding protein
MELMPIRPESSHGGRQEIFKILMVGGPKVGKSNLMYKLTYGTFDLGSIFNVGVEFGSLTVPANDKSYKVELWDTEGHKSLTKLMEGFYKNSIGRLG